MKKVLSLCLAILLMCAAPSVLAATANRSASPQATPNLGSSTTPYSMTSTVTGGGIVTTNLAASTINRGTQFNVVFDRGCFNWTALGNGLFDFSAFLPGWIRLSGATLGQDFAVAGYQADAATGALTVTYTALRGFSGTVQFYLDSTGINPTNSLMKAITVLDGDATITDTASGGTAPDCTYSGSVSLGVGDAIEYRFPADNFVWSTPYGVKNASSLTATSWIKLSGATAGMDFRTGYRYANDNSGDVIVVLNALRAGKFSNLSVYLQNGNSAATTRSAALSVTVASSSSGTGRINGVSPGAQIGGNFSGAYLNNKAIDYNSLFTLDVVAGDELLMPLYAGFFTWSGDAPYEYGAVTGSQISAGRVKLVTTSRKNGKVFDKTDIVQRNSVSYVRVKFVESYASVSDTDFEITLYLSVNGSSYRDCQLDLAGTITNDVQEISEDGEYFDISDGTILEALNHVRNAELYLGNGVTMYATLTSGRKYYGVAKIDPTSADEEIMDKYPSIEYVVTLETINLNKSGNKVTFEDTGYYVYDADYKYLGRSGAKLPYSKKYYMSTKQISIEGADSGLEVPMGDSPLDVPVPLPDTASSYDNPFTGRPA